MDKSNNSETPRQSIINFLTGPAPISKTPYPPIIEPKKQTRKSGAKPYDRRKSSLAVTPRTLLQNVLKEKVNRNSSVVHSDDLGQNILNTSRKSRPSSMAGLSNVISSESSDPENSEIENNLSSDKARKRTKLTGKRKDMPGRDSLERELKLTESDVSDTSRSVRSRVSSHSSKSPLKTSTPRSISSPLASQKRLTGKRKKQAQSNLGITDDESSLSEKESSSSKKSKQVSQKTHHEQPQKSDLSATFSMKTPTRSNKTDADKERHSSVIPSDVTLVKKGSDPAYITDMGSVSKRTQKNKNLSQQGPFPPRVFSLRSGTRVSSVIDDNSSFKSISSTSVEDYDDYVGSSSSAGRTRKHKNERRETPKHSGSRLISKASSDSSTLTKQTTKNIKSTPSSSSSRRDLRRSAVQESDDTLVNKKRLNKDAQRLSGRKQSRIQDSDDDEEEKQNDWYEPSRNENSNLKEMSSISQKIRSTIEKSSVIRSQFEQDEAIKSRAQRSNMTKRASLHEVSRSSSETEDEEDRHDVAEDIDNPQLLAHTYEANIISKTLSLMKNNTSVARLDNVSHHTPEKTKHSRISNQKDSETSERHTSSKPSRNNTEIGEDILDYETIMNASRRLTERQSNEDPETSFHQHSVSHAVNGDDTLPYEGVNTLKNKNSKSKVIASSEDSGPETEPYENGTDRDYESPQKGVQSPGHSHANKISTSARKSRYSNAFASPASIGSSSHNKSLGSDLPLAERVSRRLAATRNAENTNVGQMESINRDREKTPVTPVRSSRSISKSHQVQETQTSKIHSRQDQNRKQNSTDDERTSMFTNYRIKELSHVNKSKLHSSPIPKKLSKGNSMISIGISPIREVEESPPESRIQRSMRRKSVSAAPAGGSPEPDSVTEKSPVFHTPREKSRRAVAEAPTQILHSARKSRRTRERSQSPQAGPSGWIPEKERQQSAQLEKSSRLTMRRSKSDEKSVLFSGAQAVETKDALPISLAKRIIQQYSGLKVPNSALPCLEECIEGFWDKTFSTLSAYAHHADRDVINKSDVELYIYRLGLAHDRNSINALIEKLLPFEMRCQVIPMAIAGNKLI